MPGSSNLRPILKRERPGAKPLSQFVPGVIGETLAARGLSEASLIADWPAIVGERLAAAARPLELRWPPRAPRRDPDAPAAATLVLRVDGAFALEAQHNAAVILARVNAHLGFRCVEKIAFRQGPLPPLRKKPPPPPGPGAEAEARAGQHVGAIEDEGLRAALARLGAHAIAKETRGRRDRGGDRSK